jgi:predicted metalloprotease with PDZ domain
MMSANSTPLVRRAFGRLAPKTGLAGAFAALTLLIAAAPAAAQTQPQGQKTQRQTRTPTAASSPAATPATEAVRYTLSFPAPQTNYVQVDASFPTGGKPSIEIMMPVWTPGSYLVREYERNVEDLVAKSDGGRALTLTKTRKNRWRVETGGAPRIAVSYRVYSREMSVRNNWVESKFAMLNGAQTFLTLVEPRVARAHDVTLTLPAAWKTSITGLPDAPDGAPHHYVAPDFDTLVDCPIVAGNPTIHTFDVSGKKHYLVDEGELGAFDGARAAQDVEKIVRAAEKLWGSLPYDKYVFFNMLTEAGGGLEHKSSTMLMASRFAMSTRPRYLGWLKLVSHEYFHAWNVKRLRPVELGPFDYENEVYTTGLWVAEGLTDYYADLQVRRAGLQSAEEYLADVSGIIRSLQTTPGRLEQPVEMSSYDAWIKAYRSDEHSVNTAISYYTKGAVLGFLLDAKIRTATNGAKSLDDAMRLAFSRYSGPKGYTAAEFRKTIEEAAGTSFGGWWQTALESTAELDYTEALDWFGLRFAPAPERPADERGWLGLGTRTETGRLLVSQVRRGTPGFDAGFNLDDEILAINDLRVRPDQLPARMEQYHPGDKASVLIARRDELMRLEATFGREPDDLWRVQVRPDVTPAQQQRVSAWEWATAP